MRNALVLAFGLVVSLAVGLGFTLGKPRALAASPRVVPATDQEAMSVAWLQGRSEQVQQVIASVTSDRREQARVFEAIRFVRKLDETSEHLLSDVRARTGLVAPVLSNSSALGPAWVEAAVK